MYLTLDELYAALNGKQTPAETANLTQRRKRARPQAMNA